MDNLKEINCKEIFKRAYENSYTWNNDNHAYQGKCNFINNDQIFKEKFDIEKKIPGMGGTEMPSYNLDGSLRDKSDPSTYPSGLGVGP